ncbi:unnamed protein product [Ostreobium quekettii]|uniref:Uncharacterized protein n=1 Tax=Ostreobium quekettii TaxID=121088 RepID=A0A8S1JDC7_9CHLO|nr:unnamed protein product [Ostreobium quekettii]
MPDGRQSPSQEPRGRRKGGQLGVDGGVHRRTRRREAGWRGGRPGGGPCREEACDRAFSPAGVPEPEIRDLGLEYRAVVAVPSVCSADIRLDVRRDRLTVWLVGTGGESTRLCGLAVPHGVVSDFITAQLTGVCLSVVMPKDAPVRVRMADPGEVAAWAPGEGVCRGGVVGDWLVEAGPRAFRLLRPLPPSYWGPEGVTVELLGNTVSVCGADGEPIDGFQAPGGVDREGVFACCDQGLLLLVLPRRGEGTEGAVEENDEIER